MGDQTCVSMAWARATGGALTDTQRQELRSKLFNGYRDFARGMLTAPLRRPVANLTVPEPPDSKLARTAEEAARDQPDSFLNHGRRTWLFGSVLAQVDGNDVDGEALYVASLLHDSGLVEQVAGEDFTLRSAARALDVCNEAGVDDEELTTALADGIVAHLTPGLETEDTILGYYIQAGAVADLIGLRSWEIPNDIRKAAFIDHPGSNVFSELPAAVAAEAEAVPEGRFALLNRYGFAVAMRVSPMRRFA